MAFIMKSDNDEKTVFEEDRFPGRYGVSLTKNKKRKNYLLKYAGNSIILRVDDKGKFYKSMTIVSGQLPFKLFHEKDNDKFILDIVEGNIQLQERVNGTKVFHELSSKGIYTCSKLFNKGVQKLCQKNLYTRAESRWDENGNLIYHVTNGEEDTKLYLAKQKLAREQVAKSDELREKGGETVKNADGTTRQRTVVKKMSRLKKAVKLPLAMLKIRTKQ